MKPISGMVGLGDICSPDDFAPFIGELTMCLPTRRRACKYRVAKLGNPQLDPGIQQGQR
jgi:hypothetical protein